MEGDILFLLFLSYIFDFMLLLIKIVSHIPKMKHDSGARTLKNVEFEPQALGLGGQPLGYAGAVCTTNAKNITNARFSPDANACKNTISFFLALTKKIDRRKKKKNLKIK
jgi:hypothetical protein